MKFVRLRLSGFKSFVEPVELFIEPGLTAIVGPNGCGKSNLFDALRWVMGETRPTSIRGAEMDDVIFNGSVARPARNVAEAILSIDNGDRSAPAAYNEFDAIEVSRRIEREAGSVYRINGRDVRQRDVQIFFADASSGAGSAAFVRQGRIGEIIGQKPLARRAILEEAAGIGGLHQRRHEAELRLKAAEANMARLDDLIREIEAALQNLKRQARQASRYRNLSGLIRKAEALAMYLRWSAGEAQLSDAEESLGSAAALVAERTGTAAEASARQANAAAGLPPLRQREAERAAALHRLVLERQSLDAKETRAREETQRLRARISQSERDLDRERALDADARTAIAGLAAEAESLDTESRSAQTKLAEARSRVTALAEALAERERSLERLTSELAEWSARRSGHGRAREEAGMLAQSAERELAAAQDRLHAALADSVAAFDLGAAEKAAEAAARESDSLRLAAAETRERFADAERSEAEARQPLDRVERELQRLTAESVALAGMLNPDGDLPTSLLDEVRVQPGFEAAFAAAFGDALDAPVDDAAPRHWRDLGELTERAALPGNVQPLSAFVQGPAALTRRLSMTGVVFPDQGTALQPDLKAGQRLVSARGDLWRWDGYTASAESMSAAAHLAQRNRLAELEKELTQAKKIWSTLFDSHASAQAALAEARESLHAAERASETAAAAHLAAESKTASAARAAAERSSRLASLQAEIRRLTQTNDDARESEFRASEALGAMTNGRALQDAVAAARHEAVDARLTDANARANAETLTREAGARRQRAGALTADRSRWQDRQRNASEAIGEHLRRQEDLRRELALAEALPSEIATERDTLLSAVAAAEAARNEAADACASAENALTGADKELKLAEAALSEIRETRARAEALAEASRMRLNELRARIRDELDAAPESLSELADLREGHELPSLEVAEQRVERLKREREQMGGVNLRAEDEAAEQETRLRELTADREDLDGAIQRLRRGIQNLNREGRERLRESFERVDKNFQRLFTNLFAGGEARLTFTESEDPLEAGLEIFARPPGKRLQSLSLLSGGEQALTALALIFAVFLVNPAPVCVLDEVDAPLDDANVERFCNLLDEMTKLAETRFLVITHHPLTMSRMHRLFGVTMAERGVSQLVSVDLAEAQQAVAAE